MKQVILIFILLSFNQRECFAQDSVILEDKQQIALNTVDSSKFSLFGNWKVFHVDYVYEDYRRTGNTYSYYRWTEKENKSNYLHGKLLQSALMNASMTIGVNSIQTYFPYFDSYNNVVYKKFYCQLVPDSEIPDYYSQFGNRNYLGIYVLCENERNDTLKSIIALNDSCIYVKEEGLYIYLKRQKDTAGYLTDNSVHYIKFVGSGELNIEKEIDFKYISFNIIPFTTQKMGKLYLTSEKKEECNQYSIKSRVYIDKMNEISYYNKVFPLNKFPNELISLAVFAKIDALSFNAEWKVYWQFLNFLPEKDTITTFQSSIYFSPGKPTKMYLQKGDEVEVMEEKGEWLHIRYYGKKIIEGWIKKKDTM